MMDKETKSVQGTEGRSIRNKLEFSGRTVVSGMQKTGFRDGRGFDRTNSQRLSSSNDEGGSIPKTRCSERRKLSSIRKKNQFRGRSGVRLDKFPRKNLSSGEDGRTFD